MCQQVTRKERKEEGGEKVEKIEKKFSTRFAFPSPPPKASTVQTYGELISFGKLIHTKNGNDILETLVILEKLLNGSGDVVVLLSDDTGVEHTGLGVEGVDSGVDTELGNTTGEGGGSVQVSEGGGRSGIGQIISGDVDGLYTGDRSLLGGGDTFLHTSHVGRKSRLISDSGRNTSEKRRHLGTS